MKKALLGILLTSSAALVSAAEQYNGRLSGMSGAGYATAGYVDGVLLNPSLGAAYGETDDFAIVFNAGGLGSDKDDLVDAMDELVDYIDYLDGISNVQDLDPSMADTLIERIRAVEDKGVQANAGASLVVAIPNEFVSVSLIAKAHAQLGALTLIDEDDYVLIENSVNEPFDTEELGSSVFGQGVMVREIGVAFAKTLQSVKNETWLVGITPKRVTVETFVYEATVSEYDEDDFDADDYTMESSATSFDAGVTYIKNNLRYSFVVRDAISEDFAAINGDTFSIKPLSTAAIGYMQGWLKAEAAVDLNAVPTFGLGGDVQILRVGMELSPLSWLQLRAGLQQDLENTLEDTYSLGLGLSPFDSVNLDVAAIKGSDNTVGGAVQLGFRF